MAREAAQNTERKRGRAILFRALAIALGLSPLLLAEGTLRLAKWHAPAELQDPLVGFSYSRPLFELKEYGQAYVTSPARLEFFRPERFSAYKEENEFRIFVLGGSTVQGRPYAIETSFSTWLELNLQAADPSRDWQVVNCGGVSYASYRLAPIMQELLDYEPDLVIICCGHNEFLEDRTYQHIKRWPSWTLETLAYANRFRTPRWIRNFLSVTGKERQSQASDIRTQLPAEVETRLDFVGGLEGYTQDDTWQRAVIEHFRFNLSRMVRIAQESNTGVLLVNPACRLKDCPPFKHTNSAEISTEQKNRFDQFWDEARAIDGRTPTGLRMQLELLDQAIAIDHRHAGVQYQRAVCLESLGDLSAARDGFLSAKDEDVCPLRILESMRNILSATADQHRISIVDAQGAFERRSQGAITGDSLLIDHVHPTIHGHQLIAALLFERLCAQGTVQPVDDWESKRDESFKAHYATLDSMYFETAKERLAGLENWAAGRARRIKKTDE